MRENIFICSLTSIQELFLLVLAALPPSLCQSPGLEPAYLQNTFFASLDSSAASSSPGPAGPPAPIKAGLSVFAEPQRDGKSVSLEVGAGHPNVFPGQALGQRQPFVSFGQPQSLASPGGQLGGQPAPLNVGSAGLIPQLDVGSGGQLPQLNGGQLAPLNIGSGSLLPQHQLNVFSFGQPHRQPAPLNVGSGGLIPQQLSVGGQMELLNGGGGLVPQQQLNGGGGLIPQQQLNGEGGLIPQHPAAEPPHRQIPFLNLGVSGPGAQLNVGARGQGPLHSPVRDQVTLTGPVPPTPSEPLMQPGLQPPIPFNIKPEPHVGPQRPLTPILRQPQSQHLMQPGLQPPLMQPGLQPPMPFNINNRPEPQMGLEERLSQRLTFSVEPQVPPSAGVKFLQEMEIPLTLNVAENAQPPIANSPPFLADVPQRLPEFPAPKPGLMNDIAIQNLLAEPYFRGAVQSGVGPAIPAVPVAAAPTEIANQEAVNVGELLSNNVPGPLSAELARSKVQTDIQPVAGCEPTFVEECHNEYEMVCEETTTEREREVCDTVMEEVCETVLTTEYEPACFQKIINHCGNVSHDFSY